MCRRSSRLIRQQPVDRGEGLTVLEFLRGVCALIGHAFSSEEDDSRFIDLYSRYVDDFGGDSRGRIERMCPGLRVIGVRMEIIRSGHSGYCSDPDDEDFVADPGQEVYYIALPEGLVGDVDDIEPEDFDVYEHSQCWCGGQVSRYSVIGIIC